MGMRFESDHQDDEDLTQLKGEALRRKRRLC